MLPDQWRSSCGRREGDQGNTAQVALGLVAVQINCLLSWCCSAGNCRWPRKMGDLDGGCSQSEQKAANQVLLDGGKAASPAEPGDESAAVEGHRRRQVAAGKAFPNFGREES